jgi:hypothetical protein
MKKTTLVNEVHKPTYDWRAWRAHLFMVVYGDLFLPNGDTMEI